MRFYKFLIILPILWWASDAQAQVMEEPSSVPQKWQLTLDVIKSKAQSLMVENNGLQDEYQQLKGQLQQIQQAIDEQQEKNDEMDHILKIRHGRTEQQLQIDELTENIKLKKQRIKAYDEQVRNLTRKESDLRQKIQLLNDKASELALSHQSENTVAQPVVKVDGSPADDQLTQLRSRLEDENKQEVILANELDALKKGDAAQNSDVGAIEEQNKHLQARLDVLNLQRSEHSKTSPDSVMAQDNEKKYHELKMRKDELEADINDYESRLDRLRESSVLALSWRVKKKELVHALVQTDARNNQMRSKIKDLREDIDVLKDQVVKLEHRVDAVGPKDAK